MNIDPGNNHILMETSLPTPMTARVYVNLPEGMMLGIPPCKKPLILYSAKNMPQTVPGMVSSIFPPYFQVSNFSIFWGGAYVAI